MDSPAPAKSQPSAAGISIRNGPVNGDPMDIDQPNGGAKRKARQSISKPVSYKDESDSDDAAPLVRIYGILHCNNQLQTTALRLLA